MSIEPTIPRTVVAEALGVTTRTLQAWEARDGLDVARAPGRKAAYNVAALLRWLLDRGVSAGPPLQQARVREMEARAGLRELELAQKAGELLHCSAHEAVVEHLAAVVNGFLRAIPGRWPTRLPGPPREVAAALKRLSVEAVDDLDRAVADAMAGAGADEGEAE